MEHKQNAIQLVWISRNTTQNLGHKRPWHGGYKTKQTFLHQMTIHACKAFLYQQLVLLTMQLQGILHRSYRFRHLKF